MNSKLHLLFFIFILSYPSIVCSQTYAYDSDDSSSIYSIEKNIEGSLLLTPNFIENKATTQLDNTVVIQQIGNFNQVEVNSKSQLGYFDIKQLGNDNAVFIRAKAHAINETVYQMGDNHNFVDFSTSTGIHDLELIQRGNSQNLIWYGGNTISEQLKINMQGENQSIIVRNFN